MNQIDLYDIYDYLDHATVYESYIVSRCPFHDDIHPSFFVNKKSYNCQSCGQFGKTEHLLEIIETGVIRPKTQEFSKNPFYFASSGKELADYLSTSHKSCVQFNQMNYWKSRGITKQTIVDLQLGYRDSFVTIPVTNVARDIVGGVGRNTTDKGSRYTTPRGQKNLLYVPDWDSFENSERIYFPFGMIDAISLYQENYPCATFTNGKNPAPELLDSVRKSIAIIPDKGEEKDAFRLAGMLGWRGRVLKIDYGNGKDLNDTLMKNGEIML